MSEGILFHVFVDMYILHGCKMELGLSGTIKFLACKLSKVHPEVDRNTSPLCAYMDVSLSTSLAVEIRYAYTYPHPSQLCIFYAWSSRGSQIIIDCMGL